jgi:hypothetical protein
MRHDQAQQPLPAPERLAAGPPSGRLRGWWSSGVGVIGGVVGLAPHVLHHVGPLVGGAMVAGAAGTVLFGAIGLVASLPFLLRLRRRFASWWAPAIALAVFAAMFSLSSFVIGPMVGGDGPASPVDNPPTPDGTGHLQHHQN